MSDKNPYNRSGMFAGASHLLFEKAKQFRKNMTKAEEVLWMHLKNGIIGLKFRRQHPIGNYIADFFCHKVKLIVETDGSIHNIPETRENDLIRQNDLKELGYTVIRFSNLEVYNQIEQVLDIISQTVNNIIKSKTPVSGV